MIYSPLWGTVISWVGAMLGAAAAFGLARLLGWPFVRRIQSAEHCEQLAAWSSERGALALLISRLIPVIAFNLINYAAGLAGISRVEVPLDHRARHSAADRAVHHHSDRLLTLPPWTWLPRDGVILFGWIIVERRSPALRSYTLPPLHLRACGAVIEPYLSFLASVRLRCQRRAPHVMIHPSRRRSHDPGTRHVGASQARARDASA